MLKKILIQNLTLVESLELDLESGLVCITGETGAGKSALIHALYLLSGQKARKEKVRQGSEKALVEGLFKIVNPTEINALLEKHDIEDFDDELTIYREVSSQGKSKARINGVPVSQVALTEFGTALIQMHGQSEQVRLKDLKYHLGLFDLYAQPVKELEEYQKERLIWLGKKKEIDQYKSSFAEKKEQRDFIEFQLKDLRKADLKAGEDDDIKKELKAMEGASQLQELKDSALDLLRDSSPSILQKLDQLKEGVDSLAEINEGFLDTGKKIADAAFLLEEVLDEVSALRVPDSVSVPHIDQLNSRLSQLQSLQRKYRSDLEGLIALKVQREVELKQIDHFEEGLQDLQNELEKYAQTLRTKAGNLTRKRVSVKEVFDQKITELIRGMGMPGAVFESRFSKLEGDFPFSGLEEIEFWVEANTGEGKRPLRSTLSGGELSRVMLAIKSLMAGTVGVPVLVFDEVDSGISGEVGHKVSDVLKALGANHQVFAITHLHQVASKAQTHIKVEKEEVQGRTVSKALCLDKKGRIEEIARMLGGAQKKETLEHAKVLLEDC